MSVDDEHLDYVNLDDVDDLPAVVVDGGQERPPLVYGSVDEFVREYLRHTYKRSLDPRSRRWAPDWWRYDEAVIRLEALWRAWEHLRQDPGTGMSSWLLHHADPQMAALFDKDGPFAAAPEVQTTRGEPLPYEAPPAAMFPDERHV